MMVNRLTNGIIQGKGYKIYAAKILEDFGNDVTGGKLKNAAELVTNNLSDSSIKNSSDAHTAIGKSLVKINKNMQETDSGLSDGTIIIKKSPKNRLEAQKAHSSALNSAKSEYNAAKKLEDAQIQLSNEHIEKQKLYNKLFQRKIIVD